MRGPSWKVKGGRPAPFAVLEEAVVASCFYPPPGAGFGWSTPRKYSAARQQGEETLLLPANCPS
jgi:hypothetical protein